MLNFVTYRDIKKEYTVKAATKNLLMAAVGIIQHAQEINSTTGTAAIKGEQINYDDVCGRLCADLEDLEKTIEIIASQEAVDISAAYCSSCAPCA